MPQTTQCPNCGVVLNLPENAFGKRLKCPKCGTRFATDGAVGPKPGSAAPDDRGTPGPASSLMLTTRQSEPDLPTAEGDLRDTFDPSLLGEDPGAHSVPPKSGAEASVAGLFEKPASPRGPATKAEARSKPRRCPTCSGVVPAGMSLCARCGLDLDTGQRHHLEELFESPMPATRSSGPPLVVSIIGIMTLIVSLIVALLGILNSQDPEIAQWVYASLILVGGFGVYASVQFLRGKAMRPLVAALLLGAVLDVGVLIILPAIQANASTNPAGTTGHTVSVSGDEIQIESYANRLEPHLWKINWGIAILLVDVGLIVFLTTGGIKRHFEHHRLHHNLPIP